MLMLMIVMLFLCSWFLNVLLLFLLLFFYLLRGHSIFSSPPQRPTTSDFEGFFYPRFYPLHLFSYLNSWFLHGLNAMKIYGGITPEFICQPNKFNVKKDTDAKGTNGIITHTKLWIGLGFTSCGIHFCSNQTKII